MRPRLRKFALTAHVISSVGWLGAVITFLVIAIVGLTSQDAQVVRAAYLAMKPITWYVLVPLALLSLFTGIVQSLGTAWGLLRHYWVVFKLVLTILAVVVLMLYTQTIGYIAGIAADTTVSTAELRALGGSPTLHAGAALLLLLVTTILAIFKPQGMTAYGRRQLHKQYTYRR